MGLGGSGESALGGKRTLVSALPAASALRLFLTCGLGVFCDRQAGRQFDGDGIGIIRRS
jgi:hypothetical protein